MKEYIKNQLEKLTLETPHKDKVYAINAIYAVLQSKGYKTKEIRIAIEEVIKEKLLILTEQVKIILDDLNENK